MSIIPEVRAVKQLKQYYQMIEDAKASMQKGGGKRKKGGTRHKNLGIKINEIDRKIKLLREKIMENSGYIDDFASDITSNSEDIGIIKSYINYKMNTIHSPEEVAALDKWMDHLNNMDRGNPMNQAIIRNSLSMGGGRRRKTRKRRRKNKKTKRKRRINKKSRRKKSRK